MKMRKRVAACLALLMVLLCAQLSAGVAEEQRLSLQDVQDLTYTQRIIENHKNMHQQMIYLQMDLPDGGKGDYIIDYYYLMTDDGVVLYTEDSTGMKQMLSRDRMLRTTGDGGIELLGFIDDNAFETIYLPMVEGPFYTAEIADRIVANRKAGNQRYVTIEHDAETSPQRPIWESLWGIVDGRIFFELVFDEDMKVLLDSSIRYVPVDGPSRLILEGPIEYDVDYVVPDFVKKAVEAVETRKVTVIVDPGSDDSRTYTYNVPEGVAFALQTETAHELYTDETLSQPFTGHDGELPEECTIYVKTAGQ